MEIFLDNPQIKNNKFYCDVIIGKRMVLGVMSMRVPDDVINYNPEQIDTPIEFTVRSASVDSKLEKHIVVALCKKFKRAITVKKFNDMRSYKKHSLPATSDVYVVCKEESPFAQNNVYFGKKQIDITHNGLVSVKFRFNKKVDVENLFNIVKTFLEQFMVVEISESRKYSEFQPIYRGISDENLMLFLSDLYAKMNAMKYRQIVKTKPVVSAPKKSEPKTKPEKIEPITVVADKPDENNIEPDITEPDIITEKPANLDPIVLGKRTNMTLKPNTSIETAKKNAQKIADNSYCCVKIFDSSNMYICTVYPHSSAYHLQKMRNLTRQILNYTQPTQER